MRLQVAMIILVTQLPQVGPTRTDSHSTVGTGASPTAAAGAANTTSPTDTNSREIASTVRRGDGESIPFAIVSLRLAASRSLEWRSSLADSTGRFRFDSVALGRYELRVAVPGQAVAVTRTIVVDRNDVADVVVPVAAQPGAWWVILVLLVYLLSVIVTRWHHIARSVDEMLQRQLSALETRLLTEVSVVDERVLALRKRVQELKEEVTLGAPRFSTPSVLYPHGANAPGQIAWWRFWAGPSKRRRFWEFWFWSRGRENAAWMAIHEVERQLAAFLSPDEYVDSYLTWVSSQLRMIGKADATSLTDAITSSLGMSLPADASARASLSRGRRALLGRALAVIYNERDTSFSTLMEWHNKASWLMLAALLIIGALASAAGGAVLFLAGAAGGFSSRLMRALSREEVPLDYGASWTTLFLSPLFGALAGWFGIALVTFATSSDVNLLGDAFRRVDWYDPTHPITLAIAFMMGFSERLFSAVTSAVELHAERATEPRALPTPATPGRNTAGGTGTTSGTSTGTARMNAAAATLQLPTRAVPRSAPIPGSVTLATPALIDVEVNLLTTSPLYALRPPILTIPAGESAGSFELVALEGATPGIVAIQAYLLHTQVNGSVEVA